MNTNNGVTHIPLVFDHLDRRLFRRLDCVTLGVFDCPHSTPKLTPIGPLVVRTQDIMTGVLRTDEAARVSEETYRARIAQAEPVYGDLLYSREGTYFGIAAEVPQGVRVCLGQRMVLIRPDPSQIDHRYLKYWLNSPQVAAHVRGFRDGSVAERLNLPTIREMPVYVRPVTEQRAIAGILAALDDKIEQNRRTSRALEALARATFKAWFVDFEPVKAKAAGASSFPGMPHTTFAALPDRLVDSAIGPVPRHWGVEPVTVAAAVAIGKTPPRKEPQWFSRDRSQVPWASIADMGSSTVFIQDTSEYLSVDAIERFSIRRIPAGSVLYSFKLTLGRVVIADCEMTSNEAIAHFIPFSPDTIGTEYLYCYLAGFDHTLLGSTSSIATATNSKAVKAMPMVVPMREVAAAFTNRTRPLFDMIRALGLESRRLSALREYLLPRLLNGRVRVRPSQGDVQA